MSGSQNLIKFPLILIFFLIGCSTIEFIPDYDYKNEYAGFSKKNWSETEIHTSRPKKTFRILGTLIIRNFEGNLTTDKYKHSIQKELFALKVDGIWLTSGKIMEVEPLVVRTENSSGMPVAYYESGREMAKITGFVFRYKK